MMLRKKVPLVVGITLGLSIIVFYVLARLILLESYARLDKQKTYLNVERVLSALADDISALNSEVGDWAAWDDTYAFIEGGADDYVRRNLPYATFAELRLSLVLFIHSSGRVVFGRGFDLRSNHEMPVPGSLQEHLSPDSLVLSHGDTESSIAGIILLPEGPLLFASRPILTSGREGPLRGTLIMGRFLDSLELERLSELTHLSLSMYRFNDPEMPPDFQSAKAFLFDDVPVVVRTLDAESIAGYAVLQDVYGNPALLLRTDIPSDIYRQGRASVRYFLLSMMAVALVFVLVTLFFLEETVLSRLAHLGSSIASIGRSGDLSRRVAVTGRDELWSLGGEVNSMLEALEQSRNELQESEKRYRVLAEQLSTAHQQLVDIIEFLPDPTFVIYDKKVIAWNRAMEEMTCLSKKEMIGKGDYTYAVPFHGTSGPLFIDIIAATCSKSELEYEYVQRKENTLYAEVFVPSVFKGSGAFLWVKASPLFDLNGKLVGAIESIRDITERKQAEERLKYLSLHDPLTGLYNRTYFEQELNRLEGGRYHPIGVIVCDVDGLKLINDTLGHDAGDRLLLAAAGVIKDSFRKGDMVARIGGDEFRQCN